jgi:hypothetical protein
MMKRKKNEAAGDGLYMLEEYVMKRISSFVN